MEAVRRAGGEGEPSLTRRREVPDILSWLQCFSMYAAVLGAHYPEKMELLAYQALIISVHRRCGGRGWLLYDAAFRKQISNIQEADFSRLNQSLYLTTFSCSHCLLSDHTHEECTLRPPRMMVVSERAESKGNNWRDVGKAEERHRKRGACFTWNDGSCRLPYCHFKHVCSRCFGEHSRDACWSHPDEGEGTAGELLRGGGPWASDTIM